MTMPYTGGMAYSQGRSPMRIKSGQRGRFARFANRDLFPELTGRDQRADDLAGPADDALANPEQTIGTFRGYYEDLANGFAAPALRDLGNQRDANRANVATRFGGNISGEEIRQDNTITDSFSRSMSEALARLAPQAVEQGLGYAGQLEEKRGRAASESDQLRNLILQGLLGTKKRKKKGGGIWGALGSAAGSFASGLVK